MGYFWDKRYEGYWNKKTVWLLGTSIVIALLVELLVFNYKWLFSIGEKPLALEPVFQAGFVDLGNGSYYVESDNAVIQFPAVGEELHYLYFRPGNGEMAASLVIGAIDEANAAGLWAPQRVVHPQVERSQYIRLHFSGKVENLWVFVSGIAGNTLEASSIALNVRVPLFFSWGRALCVWIFMALGYGLRPGSGLCSIKTDLKKSSQLFMVLMLFAVWSCFFWRMIHWNITDINSYRDQEHHRQYYELIDSLLEGRLYISAEVPEALLNMDNPYDYGARYQLGIAAKWDYAFYDGRYYSYFGVLPLLILYLPFHLLTGQDLPNHIALFILGLFFFAGILYLLWQLVRRWYRNTPFVLYLLLAVVSAAAAGIAYTVYKPDFYIVPGMAALVLVMFGLGLWISAGTTEVSEGDSPAETGLHCGKAALGALLVALTADCRPQFLIAVVLGAALFWEDVFRGRRLFSQKSVKQTLALCVPFALVGAATMWYNYARFDNPFDFGAAYNLTTNDMTRRGFVWGRIGLGLFTYFLQPVQIGAVFPFLKDFGAETIYQGLTLTERLIGGALWLYPVLWMSLYGAVSRRMSADRGAVRIVRSCVLSAVIVVILDTQMAGLLTRYYLDFVWLCMLASCIVIFSLHESYGAKRWGRSFFRAVMILCAATLAFAFLSIFAHSEDSIMEANPLVYHTLRHLIAFWE